MIVGVLSIAALTYVRVWEEWINLLLGAWLFVSPWVLQFSGNPTMSWNAWIVGALIFLIAACELSVVNQMVDRDRSTRLPFHRLRPCSNGRKTVCSPVQPSRASSTALRVTPA